VTAAPHELTCREVNDFLGAYFAGEIGSRERVLFDEHLAVCPDCRTYLSQYRTTQRLAKAAFDADALEAGVPEDLVQAILAARPEASGSPGDKLPPRRRR
jgi:predicted anti-sigma-YlaC factor YlaD